MIFRNNEVLYKMFKVHHNDLKVKTLINFEVNLDIAIELI